MTASGEKVEDGVIITKNRRSSEILLNYANGN